MTYPRYYGNAPTCRYIFNADPANPEWCQNERVPLTPYCESHLKTVMKPILKENENGDMVRN